MDEDLLSGLVLAGEGVEPDQTDTQPAQPQDNLDNQHVDRCCIRNFLSNLILIL